jgi:hypothetical protein
MKPDEIEKLTQIIGNAFRVEFLNGGKCLFCQDPDRPLYSYQRGGGWLTAFVYYEEDRVPLVYGLCPTCMTLPRDEWLRTVKTLALCHCRLNRDPMGFPLYPKLKTGGE